MNAPATKTNIAELRGKDMSAPRHTMADIVKMPKAKQLPAMLESFHNELKRALPSHLNADRVSRIALTAFRRNPKLATCEPASVFAAIIQSAQLGLEIDTLGRAYLVPYDKRDKVNGQWKTVSTECQFIPGWKGLVELVHRAGQASVWTGAVTAGDYFEYALGDSPYLKHRPVGESEDITHFYAIGRPKGADYPVIEVWSAKRVTKHRDKYNKVGEKHYSFGNWEMYGRKVVLLQVLKYLPMSPELAKAVELDNAAEGGRQGLNVEDAIEGTWQPVVEEESSGGAAEQPDATESAGAETSQQQQPAVEPQPQAQAQTTSRKRAPSLDLE